MSATPIDTVLAGAPDAPAADAEPAPRLTRESTRTTARTTTAATTAVTIRGPRRRARGGGCGACWAGPGSLMMGLCFRCCACCELDAGSRRRASTLPTEAADRRFPLRNATPRDAPLPVGLCRRLSRRRGGGPQEWAAVGGTPPGRTEPSGPSVRGVRL